MGVGPNLCPLDRIFYEPIAPRERERRGRRHQRRPCDLISIASALVSIAAAIVERTIHAVLCAGTLFAS